MTATYHAFDTPIGALRLVGGEDSIIRIELPNRAAELPDPAWRPSNDRLPAALSEAKRQIREYFAGERQDFDLPLSPHGTAFQRRVWTELRRIPFGETISYGELAARIGKPTASRAVGAANGRNPLPVVVPCHRVIGSDGRLTGFGGGLPTKQALLDLERRVAGRQLLLAPVLSSRATS
ncbi:MAG: methylated-DNA--[protein]-cysteine S-methyltransferase [Holophagales bacterium]|nr:methylated-DNA--[protein]-cysteine S-methyltransferase [Holophagales bacterium]MYC09488.1 methylated-DNA--[protein]-cysteine S-methyltransferase [Holophagales bacterium]